MKPYWNRAGPNPNDWCPYKKNERVLGYRDTVRSDMEEGPVMSQAEIGLLHLQGKKCNHQKLGERPGTVYFRAFRRIKLAATLIRTSGFLNCERIDRYCFKCSINISTSYIFQVHKLPQLVLCYSSPKERRHVETMILPLFPTRNMPTTM